VISGEKRQLDQAVAALNQAGVSRIVVLQVDGAFHSRLMTGAAQRFAPVLAATPIHEPRCPVAQNAVGALVIDPDHLRCNLAAQVTGTVRWQECVQAMLSVGVEAMVELGPGRALSGFMRRIEPGLPTFSVGTVADLEKAVAALG
jgi:[acyl-carrier-protein] S-malonyltransferase